VWSADEFVPAPNQHQVIDKFLRAIYEIFFAAFGCGRPFMIRPSGADQVSWSMAVETRSTKKAG
jgi:hypothetical protein